MEKISKKFEQFLSLLIFLPALLTSKVLDSDFYFLYMHGKCVIENRFPKTDFLSMHEQISFVMQQWLSSVIIFIIYEKLGKIPLIFFVMLIEILTIFTLYKTLNLICNNKTLSKILTLPSSLVMILYSTQRPFIFTYLIIIYEIYLLLKYTKTNDVRYLYILPILSILQINLHSSMWCFLFIFALPFLTELKLFNFGRFYTDKFNKFQLLYALFISFLCGFCNPYGIDNILYIARSKSKVELGIYEMSTPTLSNIGGQIIMVVIVILFLILFNVTCKINIRYFNLFIGCLALSFYAIKLIPFLVLSMSLLLAEILKEINIETILTHVFGYYKVYIPILTISFFIVSLFSFKDFFCEDTNDLKDATAYLTQNFETKNSTIYCGFNDGAYLEFCGFKPYIDARMEIYLEKQNKQKDYIKEYYNLQHTNCDLNAFLEEYKFEYVLASSTDSLFSSDKYDNNYELIYQNDSYNVFKRN